MSNVRRSGVRACSESKRAIVGAVVGFAYGSILAYLSFLAMGAGHGSFLPFFLSSAPLGVLGFFGDFGFYAALFGGAPLVWTTFGALVAPSSRAKWLRLTQVLALSHYASGLALIAATTGLSELARLARVLRLSPEFIVPWAAVYLVGQVALWWRASTPSERRPTV
jgi:hypothetical protein